MGLAGAHHVGEGLHGLLERREPVETVRLVQVDVVGPEPAQGVVDGLHDVLARKAAVVAPRPGGPVDLGEYFEALPAFPLQRPAEDGLRTGLRVDVGGVEGGDSRVEGRAHAGDGGLLLDLRTVGEPVAIGDFADQQTTAAKMTVFHEDQTLRLRSPGCQRARPGSGGHGNEREDGT